MPKQRKTNQGLDYSDIQELAVATMRKFKRAKKQAADDANQYKWNSVAEKLVEEAEKRVTQQTYNKEAHKALKYKLEKALC